MLCSPHLGDHCNDLRLRIPPPLDFISCRRRAYTARCTFAVARQRGSCAGREYRVRRRHAPEPHSLRRTADSERHVGLPRQETAAPWMPNGKILRMVDIVGIDFAIRASPTIG